MLSELLPGMTIERDVRIDSVTDDSRRVARGALFIASRGTQLDGRAFIRDAVDRHAAAILCEPPLPGGVVRNVPVIELEDLSRRKGRIASRFFGRPSDRLHVIAVTGTVPLRNSVRSAMG